VLRRATLTQGKASQSGLRVGLFFRSVASVVTMVKTVLHDIADSSEPSEPWTDTIYVYTYIFEYIYIYIYIYIWYIYKKKRKKQKQKREGDGFRGVEERGY